MLKFEKIDCTFFRGENGLDLFKKNPTVLFEIKAPIYWWIDTDWIKYYLNMPLDNFEFDFSAFDCGRYYAKYMRNNLNKWKDEPRKLMQVLPLSTVVKATLELSYQEIVEVCENYVAGEYYYTKGYGFPNDREWADFCETLLDIKGIRDLVKEEI